MTPEALKATLLCADVTFADCKLAFAAPADDPLVAAARIQYHEEGVCEIDDRTVVSRSDDPSTKGAYVMAWLWVEDPTQVDGDSCSIPGELG